MTETASPPPSEQGRAGYRNPAYFLLVSERPASPFAVALARALGGPQALACVAEPDAAEAIRQECYQAVIVDGSTVAEPASLVSRLREVRPGLPIVVFTSSPTWQRARAVLLAGAADYLRESLDEQELCWRLDRALKRPPLEP